LIVMQRGRGPKIKKKGREAGGSNKRKKQKSRPKKLAKAVRQWKIKKRGHIRPGTKKPMDGERGGEITKIRAQGM